MKSRIIPIFFALALLFFASLAVAQNVIENPFDVTVIIGGGGSTTTTTIPANITIDNPANINFNIVARTYNGQSQNVIVTLYDHVGHDFLNTSQFTGLGYLFSPSSIIDFELSYDNRNLDMMVNNFNITNMDGLSPQITIQKVNTQIPGFNIYRAYKVELPTNFNYNDILLKIKLADVSGVNYGNITVYRCVNYDMVNNNCPSGWENVNPTISTDLANQLISFDINHFSVYVIGNYGNASSTTTTTTVPSGSTTTTVPITTTTTIQATTTTVKSSSGGGPSGGDGNLGGGFNLPPLDISTTTTTTETGITASSNSTTSTTNKNQSALTGMFTNISNTNYLIAGIVIIASAGILGFYIYQKYSTSSMWHSKSFFNPRKQSKSSRSRKRWGETSLSL